MDENDVPVIPLGVDTDQFYPNLKWRGKIRTEMEINDSVPVIIHAGKLQPEKDIHILIRALAKLATDDIQYRVLIIGSGPTVYVDLLRRSVKEAGIEKNVYWIDMLSKEQLSHYFAAADIGVWPGNPSLSVREAISSGLPVVIPIDDPLFGHHRFLLSRQNGLTFERGNAIELAECMRKLLTDTDLRQIMSRQSRSFAMEVLDWKVIARTYLDLYRGTDTSSSVSIARFRSQRVYKKVS